MVKLTENKVNNVSYDKNGDYSDREIIPIRIPKKNVMALDVTSCTEDQKLQLIEIFKDYKDYVDHHMSLLFNFKEWVEQTDPGFDIEIEYRNFKLKKLKNI